MIPIFKPFMPKDILSGVEEILYSGKLAFGKYGIEFENSLREYFSNPYSMTVSSYSQAMLVVLTVLDLKPGDEIIASPVSCLASNQPFINKNLKVVWADINPLTGTLDPDDIEHRITSKTKAIFINHYCGYIVEIDKISSIAKAHNIFLVDDCIEAFGGKYNTDKIGNTITDVSIFNFQTVRLPNTIEGGAITFKDESLFSKALKVRDYGIDRNNFRNVLGEINPDCDIELEGYGALLGELNSYIGVKQMSSIDQLLMQQEKNARKWDTLIQKIKGIEPLRFNQNSHPNYWVYGVLCEDKNEALKMFRESGFYATSVHINNNIYSVFNNMELLPGVNKFMKSFLALPSGWWVKEDDICI